MHSFKKSVCRRIISHGLCTVAKSGEEHEEKNEGRVNELAEKAPLIIGS